MMASYVRSGAAQWIIFCIGCSTILTAANWWIWVTPSKGQEQLTGEEARKYVLMLCDGFDKNRAAFQRFTCRFVVACGTAQCRGEWWKADEWDERLPNVRQVAECLLVRDRNVLRYSIQPREHKVYLSTGTEAITGSQGRMENSSVAYPSQGCFQGINILGNDQYVFFDSSMGPQAIISRVADRSEAFAAMITPWNPIFLNDYAYLDWLRHKATRSDGQFKIQRNVTLGSHRVTLVHYVGYVGNRQAYGLEYYVDESRGYLPLKMIKVPDKNSNLGLVRATFTEVAHVEGHGWFPMKWTHVGASYGDGNVIGGVDELRVTELTMGRPKSELLQVKIAKGRHLIDQTHNPALHDLVIEQDTAITVNDIPELLDRYYNPNKYMTPAKPLWPRVLLVACGVVATLAVATYLYYRHLQR